MVEHPPCKGEPPHTATCRGLLLIDGNRGCTLLGIADGLGRKVSEKVSEPLVGVNAPGNRNREPLGAMPGEEWERRWTPLEGA